MSALYGRAPMPALTKYEPVEVAASAAADEVVALREQLASAREEFAKAVGERDAARAKVALLRGGRAEGVGSEVVLNATLTSGQDVSVTVVYDDPQAAVQALYQVAQPRYLM